MKRFLKEITLFFIVLLSFIFFYFRINADGFTDPFYLRFTTKKQKNLILGSSRAAQGIQPQTLKSITNNKFYNFSFSNLHSPYGSTYFNAIKNKIDRKSKQTFILCVNRGYFLVFV